MSNAGELPLGAIFSDPDPDDVPLTGQFEVWPVQHPAQVTAVHPVPLEMVRAQLDAWDFGYAALFDEFESALIARKRSSPSGYEAALGIALGIFEYHAAGTAIIRTSVGLEYSLLAFGVDGGGAAGLSAGYADGALGFLGLLVKDMERGPALA